MWLGTKAAASHKQRDLDEFLAELARLLEQKHGGTWACKYDHELLMMRKI